MDTHVIVVGAGPAGLMLAGELRLGGAEVVVLERLAEPTTESRATTVHARTMEIFDERGLLARVGNPPNERMGHFAGIRLDFGNLPTRFPGLWKIPQRQVEQVLGQRAQELGADIRRRHDVVGLSTEDDRVRVSAAGPDGTVELLADYVVACDGEDSTVRELSGVDFPGAPATRELLRADVAGIDIPNRRFERLPNGLAIASRMPGGVTRVMVCEAGRPAVRRAAAPSFEEFCATWERVTGEDIRGGTPRWVNSFGNARRQVARYRAGRVLFAGDAAHVQMPSGGQAINLGIQDAVNLGWKLAAVATGRAPESLLDTYHDERHAVGGLVLNNIGAQALLLLAGTDMEPLRDILTELIACPAVHDRLTATISGLDVRYDVDHHPLVGARLPQMELRGGEGASGVGPSTVGASGVGASSTTELLRTGHGVLLDLSADPSRRAALCDAVAGFAPRVDLVSATVQAGGTAGGPVGGTVGEPVAGLDTLLLRPDGHVAWVSQRAADPRPALRRWFGPPAP